MYDFLEFSETRDEHLRNLEEILSRLGKGKYYVAPNKCSVLKPEAKISWTGCWKEGASRQNGKFVSYQNLTEAPNSIRTKKTYWIDSIFLEVYQGIFTIGCTASVTHAESNLNFSVLKIYGNLAFEKLKIALTTAPVFIFPKWKKNFTAMWMPPARVLGVL